MQGNQIKSKQRVKDNGEVFTPDFIVDDMLALVKNETGRIESRFLEPACGDGTMAEVLKQYADDVICTDIRDTGYGQGGVDFLTTIRGCDAIITNPPFNLSEAFIRHALTIAEVVAMVLKSQYWHAKRRTELFNELPPSLS